MHYTIQKLTVELINESFFETCFHLQPIHKSIESTKKIWEQQQSNPDYIRLVAVEWEDNVIWSIACLLEQKFIMEHAICGHLEDVVIRKWYEWMWIWKALVDQVTQIAQERWCLLIGLSCSDANIWFYEKCWYKTWSNKMKLIIN